MEKCKCCGRGEELRNGFCFDCADSEAVIQGVDMYDKEIPKIQGFSESMSKVKYIIDKYINNKN